MSDVDNRACRKVGILFYLDHIWVSVLHMLLPSDSPILLLNQPIIRMGIYDSRWQWSLDCSCAPKTFALFIENCSWKTYNIKNTVILQVTNTFWQPCLFSFYFSFVNNIKTVV